VCTTNWCIILFLIFLVIYYLLSSPTSAEPLTDLSKQSLEASKAMLASFPTGTGFTAQDTKLEQSSLNNGIPPQGWSSGQEHSSILNDTGIKDIKAVRDEMTKTGPQGMDASIVDYYAKQMKSNMEQKEFNVADFLPQEINQDWFNTDLTKAQNEIDQATLIEISRFCQGVDTVGQSMKNPSYDIRGNIPNPKITISPFLNSSYDPDTNLKSWST